MIDSESKLAAFCPRLQKAAWTSLDSEADSLHSHPEKLCLLQLSLPDGDELIDPLAGLDLTPFFEALSRRELILHGADYDLRLLWRTFRFTPATIFETMLAARLLGFTEFGLTDLARSLLGIHLEKGPQKADWARRPLTERMETYAHNDTRYLKPISDLLREQLQAKGRLRWHQEMCARLINQCAVSPVADADQVWRIKGADKLDRRGLASLRELWRWREEEALAVGKPPYFILSHETMVALANAAAHSQPLRFPPKFPFRRREGLEAAVRRAQAIPPSQWPEYTRSFGRRLTEAEKHRYEELRLRRDRHASRLAIDPSLIASKAVLLSLATNEASAESELMSWQRELLD